MNKIKCFLLVFVLLSSGVFAQQLEQMIVNYSNDKEALYRRHSIKSSKSFYERLILFYQDYSRELKGLSFNSLSSKDKVDYLLLRNQIDKELYFLRVDYDEFNNVAEAVSFAEPLYRFISQRDRGDKLNSEYLANSLHDVTLKIGENQKRLGSVPYVSWQQADKASKSVEELRDVLREAYQFYNHYDPSFTWWVERPFVQLDSTLSRYAVFLKGNYRNTIVKDDGSGIIGRPIGSASILKSLETEFIPYTPEELISIAEREFIWCEKEMLKATAEMGLGKDWKAALEKVKQSFVQPGEQPAMVTRLAEEAIAFLEVNDLVTIPPLAKETWRMRMMSPEAQKVNPFFLGGEEIIISYPTNTMEHHHKLMSMRGNNPHFSKATVHHELIPGHHLQQFMQSRYKTYRSVFDTPFWVEGWALYWEMNLWDKGFATSPEDKVGMLFWRMHRCARIIFSLNYHLGKMTPQQCIDFLVSRVGHEYANAEAEVRRSFTGGYGPLYQIAYMVGGIQLYELKKEMLASGKMTEKQFHDSVLRENCIPIEMVRAILINQPLSENFSSSWRFAH